MPEATARQIVHAWTDLETALRSALPTCALAPPTQPSELVAALRVTGVLGADDEGRIAELRRIRGRVAVGAEDPSQVEAARYEEAVRELVDRLRTHPPDTRSTHARIRAV